MKLSRLLRALALIGILSLTATTASAVTLTVIDNGLTNQNANYGCETSASLCGIPPLIFLREPAAATGTFAFNDALTIASISLHIDSAWFDQWNPSGLGVTFTNVTYSATIPISVYGGSVFQSGIGSATVSGLANGTPFSVTPQVTNLTCGSLVSATQCGIAFGENGFTVLGDDFLHTFNVLVTPVPEPGVAALLLVAGMAVLARRARVD